MTVWDGGFVVLAQGTSQVPSAPESGAESSTGGGPVTAPHPAANARSFSQNGDNDNDRSFGAELTAKQQM